MDEKKSVVTDRSKEKLKRFIDSKITKMFTGVLDYAELVIEDSRWKAYRSKVLKLANDTIRDMQREIDDNYSMSYLPPAEDVIVVRKK